MHFIKENHVSDFRLSHLARQDKTHAHWCETCHNSEPLSNCDDQRQDCGDPSGYY
jgi:hypothetical protein